MEPDDGDDDACVRVHLRGMRWRAGDVNGVGNRNDGSEGQVDASRGQTDAPSVLNGTETVRMSNSDSANTYLGAGDAKCGVDDWPI